MGDPGDVVTDGIRWRVRVGAPWRYVPACYGSWQVCILAVLQAGADAAGPLPRRVLDDVRDYAVEHLGDPDAELIVDDTGFLKT
ncbi:hypothetical protein [Streptomyces sp. NBC_01565]|uniref:hypothetical protein n=1 Tax=unclassified Streptomyces TaxID=2593676 RepID=UPI00225BD1A6|nr:hypothetical protein [Streptomyces sp. NBC_01565]MCX4546311.1 hypothetical protein [Streptomyces sp. NBC_01565]